MEGILDNFKKIVLVEELCFAVIQTSIESEIWMAGWSMVIAVWFALENSRTKRRVEANAFYKERFALKSENY